MSWNFSVIIIKVLVFLNCYISIDFETFQGVLGAVKFGETWAASVSSFFMSAFVTFLNPS